MEKRAAHTKGHPPGGKAPQRRFPPGRGVITTREELRLLEVRPEVRPDVFQKPPPEEPCPVDLGGPDMLIPPPRDGIAYGVQEVADLCRVSPRTVEGWISLGRGLEGDRVRLRSLRVPHGHIAPGDLCAFLSGVNHGVKVKVSPAGAGTAPPAVPTPPQDLRQGLLK